MRQAINFPLRSGPGTTTTLHWACERGYIRVVKALLKSGAAVNTIDSSGDTPLMRACRFGHEEVVEHLIVYGTDVDFSLGGETAFTCAAHCNHPNVMDLMFRLGTTVDRRHWWTLLSAAGGGHIDVARLLLEHGVDVNFQLDAYIAGLPSYMYSNRSAVHMAAYYQHPDMIALLVNYGADVDAVNGYGETALQYLISEWPHLSPAGEICLHELCKGNRWRKGRWKLWGALLRVQDSLLRCVCICATLICFPCIACADDDAFP
jgi:ankyrin repeat protein